MATRIRRGVEVVIPPEWEGNVTTPCTIRQRPSKLNRKLRRRLKPGVDYKDARDLPLDPFAPTDTDEPTERSAPCEQQL